MSLLAVDVGNTHTVFGVFDATGRPRASYRMQTDRNACADELYVFLERTLQRRGFSMQDVATAVVATVVPELEHEWRNVFPEAQTRFLLADHNAPWSFRIDLPNPAQLGSDRMANAEAAVRDGAPVIVVDAGTATTFDVIDRDDEGFVYRGGVIAPGVGVSMNALVRGTSRLSAVSLTREARGEFPVVGNDTESAIRSGVVRGFVAMVDGMIDQIIAEQGFPQPCPVIATGGFSGLLQGYSRHEMRFSADLTLEGLYAVAAR